MEIICENCHKTVNKRINKQRKHHFCDSKCYGEWRSKNITGEKVHNHKEKIVCKCANCNVEFSVHESRLRNRATNNIFCSYDCKSAWESKHPTGKNNPNYKGGELIKECIYCHNQYTVRQYRTNTTRFCSKGCKDLYLKYVESQTIEYKEFHRKIGIKVQQNMKNKFTKPELLVKEYLEQHKIEYITQHSMYKQFVVDFYLPKLDIVIEVLGDYWHGNPNKYGEDKIPLTEKQIKNKERDELRVTVLSQHKHKVLMIWECDIYLNIDNALSFIMT